MLGCRACVRIYMTGSIVSSRSFVLWLASLVRQRPSADAGAAEAIKLESGLTVSVFRAPTAEAVAVQPITRRACG